ncbi:MAG: hypothetical protein IKG18_07335, partial [Atopobiaceae bacterium]|nr:hypothetical protein [Atopobiaceae bacterium]
MMEHPKLTDKRRARIVERCSAQLSSMLAEAEGWYPDKVVSGAQLRVEHGGYCDRLGSLAADMGYASYIELLHNEGFDIELDRKASTYPVGHRIDPEDAVDHIVEAVTGRLGSYFEKIDEWYPDRVVINFAKLHSTTKDNLQRNALALGYESWADLLRVYGYEVPDYGGPKGGRRPSVDPEAIFAELTSRYDGVEKPPSIKMLMFENPDLKGNLKSLQNASNEFYGHTLLVELKRRGILGGRVRSSNISEEKFRTLLDDLSEKYADTEIKPRTIAELKADNPDKKELIAAFSNRCRQIYGVTPRSKFIELGILPKPKGAVIDASEEEIWQAIDDLTKLVFQLDDADKPKTLADLQHAYPELGEYVKAGKKQGVIDKGPLQRLGLLAPTKALLKQEGIRRASLESLVEDYKKLGLPMLITPESDERALLPQSLAGIDIESQTELSEFIATVQVSAVKKLTIGDKVDFNTSERQREWGDPYLVITFKTEPPTCYGPNEVIEGASNETDSVLSSCSDGEVITVAHLDGYDAAQIRVRLLSTLRRDTLAYVLRESGIVTEKDVRGSMEWRYRVLKGGVSDELAEDSSAGSNESALLVNDGCAPLQLTDCERVGDVAINEMREEAERKEREEAERKEREEAE